MPVIPYKATVVKQLNLINGATLLPSDVVLGKFAPDTTNPNKGTVAMVAATAGAVPNAGRTTIAYNRLSLSQWMGWVPNPLPISKAPTLYELLVRLGQTTGVDLTTNDVQDQALDFSSGQTTITLQAKTDSNICSGSVGLVLKAADPVNLPSVWSANKLNRTTLLADISDLIALANTTNQRFVEKQSVSWGSLQESDSPLGNSMVTFTGKDNYGYTGSVDLYFNRDDFATLFPDLYVYSTAPYNSTTRQFVKDFFPQVLTKVTLDSIVDDPVVYGSTGQDVEVPLRIAPTSLNLGGTVKAKVLWQSGTDYTSLRMSYVQYATQDISAANVASVRGRTLTRQFYPVSVRAVLNQYAVRDLTAASVANVQGRMLTRQFYGTSLRQAFLQYAVADT